MGDSPSIPGCHHLCSGLISGCDEHTFGIEATLYSLNTSSSILDTQQACSLFYAQEEPRIHSAYEDFNTIQGQTPWTDVSTESDCPLFLPNHSYEFEHPTLGHWHPSTPSHPVPISHSTPAPSAPALDVDAYPPVYVDQRRWMNSYRGFTDVPQHYSTLASRRALTHGLEATDGGDHSEGYTAPDLPVNHRLAFEVSTSQLDVVLAYDLWLVLTVFCRHAIATMFSPTA